MFKWDTDRRGCSAGHVQVERPEALPGIISERDLQGDCERHSGLCGPDPVRVPGYHPEDPDREPGPQAATDGTQAQRVGGHR